MRSHIGLSSMRNAIGSAALAIVMTGCAGEEDPVERGRTSPTPATPSPTVDEEAIAEAEADAAECEVVMGPFLKALQALDSRLLTLTSGLALADYNRMLGDVEFEYGQIPFAALGQECRLKVAKPAGTAFDVYVRAQNIWNRCTYNPQCTRDSLTTKLNSNWELASRLIGTAEDGLEGLAEPT
jgi:hypothetical protein